MTRASGSMSQSAMTSVTDYSLPTLSSASSHQVKVCREYKSGASYQGQVKDNRRTGLGVFTWPNGSKYEGEFIDNDRHGKGVQEWGDGSCYQGEFAANMRQGRGDHKWSNGESYIGRFFHDRRHGTGTYTWPDGSKYVGTFYMDKKEGYGTFYFANGNTFEGLYGSDERHGPGVLTYTDGTADVGLWRREKLVKLCATTKHGFTMRDHPEFDSVPEEQVQHINSAVLRNRTDVVHDIIHPPDQFNYPPETEVEGKAKKAIFRETLHQGSLAVDIQSFDEEFFKDDTKKKSEKTDKLSGLVKAWNKTPSSLALQSHILRHESRQHSASFSVKCILDGDRSKFPQKGPIEEASERFLEAARDGDRGRVAEFLNKGKVYVDVSDSQGHTALLSAAMNWHQDIINTLLDNGADVNHLNNEGISALAACHVYFYPVEFFKYNTAERYLKKPEDFEEEKGFDVNDVVKGTIPSTPKKKPLEHRESQIDVKKIKKLRQEYPKNLTVSISENQSTKLVSEKLDENEWNGKEEVGRLLNNGDDVREDRTLGTLHIRRTVKTNLQDMLVTHPRMNEDLMKRMSSKKSFNSDDDLEEYSDTEVDEFESIKSIRNLQIEVSDQLIERCATNLSQNNMVVGRNRRTMGPKESMGTVRRLAIDKSHQDLMEKTIRLLLRRGANPNASHVPMPVLFFAIKAADVDAVRLLLMKGASTTATLTEKKGGLAPLHIASAIPGEEGVAITDLLLNSLGHPDVRAAQDDAFLNRSLRGSMSGGSDNGVLCEELAEALRLQEEEWAKDVVDSKSQSLAGGRTALHIACARIDNYRNACRVVHLLLAHHANPNLLCNGHSPLALAIASGNDMAIDELLAYGADPCLPLTHGVGSALCIASSTEYEHRRTPNARLQLIDKLIKAGADILAPIAIGSKRISGTSVDYAYYMYNLSMGKEGLSSRPPSSDDRRVAHMPYHALTPNERETFNARRHLLAHMGDILRVKAVERERLRLEEEERTGRRSVSPSPNFTYTGAGAQLPPGIIKGGKGQKGIPGGEGHVSFGATAASRSVMEGEELEMRKSLFRYCYECGRSVGVRLSACTRCKEVYYCSKACKLKGWNARHKEECVRIGGRSRSTSPVRATNRIDSPTPATDPDLRCPTTVTAIMADSMGHRIKDKRVLNQSKGDPFYDHVDQRRYKTKGASTSQSNRHYNKNNTKLTSRDEDYTGYSESYDDDKGNITRHHSRTAGGGGGGGKMAYGNVSYDNQNVSDVYNGAVYNRDTQYGSPHKDTGNLQTKGGYKRDVTYQPREAFGSGHKRSYLPESYVTDYDNTSRGRDDVITGDVISRTRPYGDDDGYGGRSKPRKSANTKTKPTDYHLDIERLDLHRRAASEDGADWMSPRKEKKRKDKRPASDQNWDDPKTSRRSEKRRPPADGGKKKWARAPVGTETSGVSMFYPKPKTSEGKTRTGGSKSDRRGLTTIVNGYVISKDLLPPIAGSRSTTGLKCTHTLPRVDGVTTRTSLTPGREPGTFSPPRCESWPTKHSSPHAEMANVKMRMKIKLRDTRPKGLTDRGAPIAPYLGAPPGAKVTLLAP